MSACPATSETMPFSSAARTLIALSNASGPVDQAISDLPAVRHFAKRCSIERCLHLGIDRLDGRENRDLRKLSVAEQDPPKIDGVLHDVGLHREVR